MQNTIYELGSLSTGVCDKVSCRLLQASDGREARRGEADDSDR